MFKQVAALEEIATQSDHPNDAFTVEEIREKANSELRQFYDDLKIAKTLNWSQSQEMKKTNIKKFERQRLTELKRRLFFLEQDLKDERHRLWLSEKDSQAEYPVWEQLEMFATNILGYVSQIVSKGDLVQNHRDAIGAVAPALKAIAWISHPTIFGKNLLVNNLPNDRCQLNAKKIVFLYTRVKI